MILYHGTNSKNLEKIKKEGIRPRGKRKTNWKDVPSKNDLVYLTNCYACYYASAISTKKNKPIIIKLEIDPKKIKMYPDEDFLAFYFKEKYKEDIKYSLKEWSISINPKKYQKFWKDSLNFMGNIAVDYVPIEYIIGYVEEEKNLEFIMNCDASISPINYKFCSERYKKYLLNLKYKKL